MNKRKDEQVKILKGNRSALFLSLDSPYNNHVRPLQLALVKGEKVKSDLFQKK